MRQIIDLCTPRGAIFVLLVQWLSYHVGLLINHKRGKANEEKFHVTVERKNNFQYFY